MKHTYLKITWQLQASWTQCSLQSLIAVVIDLVSQQIIMLSRMSILSIVSMPPSSRLLKSLLVAVENFSSKQAAKPTGESVREIPKITNHYQIKHFEHIYIYNNFASAWYISVGIQNVLCQISVSVKFQLFAKSNRL